MKNIVFLIIFSFYLNGYAQRYYEVCSWQVETKQGGLLFGISDTKDGADIIMYNFQQHNEGTVHDISYHPVKYKFTIYPADKIDGNPVTNFQNYATKSCTVLSGDVIRLTEIDKKEGIDLSLDYYLKIRDDNRDFVKELSGDQTYAKNNTKPSNNKSEVEYTYSDNKKPSTNSASEVEYSYPDKENLSSNEEVEYSYSDGSSESSLQKDKPIKSNIKRSLTRSTQQVLSSKESNTYYTDVDQTNNQVVLWEVKTRLEGLLFGVANSKDQADAIMLDFQKRNADSKYDITDHPAKYKMTNKLDQNSVENFKNLTNKLYKVISIDDIRSLELIRSRGFDAGVEYYMDVRGASREFVTKRLSYIYNGFEKYRILPQNTKYVAASK